MPRAASAAGVDALRRLYGVDGDDSNGAAAADADAANADDATAAFARADGRIDWLWQAPSVLARLPLLLPPLLPPLLESL